VKLLGFGPVGAFSSCFGPGQRWDVASYSLSVLLGSQWNVVLGEPSVQALALRLPSDILGVRCQMPKASSCGNMKKESKYQ